ncbi:MAG: LysM peptidoglycan-binding domain-containing protein [Verrucomicrobiota bacterium]
MFSTTLRFLLIVGFSGGMFFRASAQTMPARVEPGLEKAVKWKWWAAPSEPKDWGLELPVLAHPTPNSPTAQPDAAPSRADSYEVKRGDALILIGKKFGITVEQLKAFNGLTTTTIIVGQILKIPTPMEAKILVPEPPKAGKPAASLPPGPGSQVDNVLIQVFLDREQFSSGPIDGAAGLTFQKVLQLYQSVHEETKDSPMLMAKARAVVGDSFTTYRLKPEDFRFIAPPKAAKAVPAKPGEAKAKGKPAPAATPPPTFAELSSASMLAYRSPWEFVAERFHCDEAFLHSLNEKIKTAPLAGTEFRVPNVIPFEIERPLGNPIQPAPDPRTPVTAAVLDYSLVAIYRSDTLVATMPMAVARPGLRGKDFWTIFEALPYPRLVTKQELTNPQRPASFLFGGSNPAPTPVPALPGETHLPAGPNNPAGIVWIKLGKANSTEPPPYGLHGTSIPDQMQMQGSLGWLRVTNWDILRAARLLPVGTPLQWKNPAPSPPLPGPGT